MHKTAYRPLLANSRNILNLPKKHLAKNVDICVEASFRFINLGLFKSQSHRIGWGHNWKVDFNIDKIN